MGGVCNVVHLEPMFHATCVKYAVSVVNPIFKDIILDRQEHIPLYTGVQRSMA